MDEIIIEEIEKKEEILLEEKILIPELDNLVVIPTAEEQNFKNKNYGYGDITVKAIESEEVTIIPNANEQIKEGMFNKVTVAGDSDLVPENIKEGAEIFGVQGVAKTINVKITDASYLFYSSARLDYLEELLKLCDKVTSMERMFYFCTSLESLSLKNFDTSNVKNMDYLFYYCRSLINLDISSFNTKNVTTMNTMFMNCFILTNLDVSSFDTSNVKDMGSMFYGCNSLTSLDVSNFNTSNVTNMGYMFNACKSLTSLDLSNFDMSKVISIYYMLTACPNLTILNSPKNIGKGFKQKQNNYSSYKLDLSYSPLLTHESLMSVINNLYDLNLTYDVANGGTLYAQSLTLGTTNKLKLTEEEIAIATSKGWNVS